MPPTELPDPGTEALAALRARDPHTWERLRTLYAPVVWQWAAVRGLQAVDRDDVVQDALRCGVLNYTGHAVFDLADPLNAGMVLENKEDRPK